MNPKPTGYVCGNDLILARTVQAPVEDVWASLTRAERTALWFGPWEGRAGPGEVVRLQLVHENGRRAAWSSGCRTTPAWGASS